MFTTIIICVNGIINQRHFHLLSFHSFLSNVTAFKFNQSVTSCWNWIRKNKINFIYIESLKIIINWKLILNRERWASSERFFGCSNYLLCVNLTLIQRTDLWRRRQNWILQLRLCKFNRHFLYPCHFPLDSDLRRKVGCFFNQKPEWDSNLFGSVKGVEEWSRKTFSFFQSIFRHERYNANENVNENEG